MFFFVQARKELAQQLHKSHELTEKIAEVNEENNGERNEEEEEEEENTAKPSLSDINNPWFTGSTVGKDKERGKEEEEEKNKGEEYVALEAVHVRRDSDGSDGEENEAKDEEEDEMEKDHRMLKEIQEERRRWKDGSDEEEEEEEGNDDQVEEVEVGKKEKMSKGFTKQERTKSTKVDKKSKRKKVKVIEVNDEDDKEGDGAGESILEEGVERRQTHSSLEDQDWLHRLEEEGKQLPRLQSIDAIHVDGNIQKEKESKKKLSGMVDPSKVFIVKPKEMLKSAMPLLVDQGDEVDGDNEKMEHRMNIRQAFADDDVVEEFKEEKKARIEKDKPRDIDLTLPGWGDWGGTGVQASKKKKKR